MTILKALLMNLWNFLGIVVTGGKYGSSVHDSPSSKYEAYQKQRKKEFETFGMHQCKICHTKIPGNKSYCGACYHNYKK